MCEEAWKPKESIIKAIITWAESNNFKYVSIHEDFANGCIENDDWQIQISFKESIGLRARVWPVRELKGLINE